MDKSKIGTQTHFNLGQRLLELQAKKKEKSPPDESKPEAFDQFKCACCFEIEQTCGYCKSLGLGRYGTLKEPISEVKCDCAGCQAGYKCIRDAKPYDYDD